MVLPGYEAMALTRESVMIFQDIFKEMVRKKDFEC